MTRLPSEPASKITLAFWLTLVTATGLYGFVSLAPNCLVLGDLVAHSAENRGDERPWRTGSSTSNRFATR